MKDNRRKEELSSITIDKQLYDSLREYCDKRNIRFIEFVEDSLENAIGFHEQSNLIEENKKILAQIKENYDRIHKSGFDEGFYVAFYMLQGKLWVGSNNESMIKLLEDTSKPVTGPQLKLF